MKLHLRHPVLVLFAAGLCIAVFVLCDRATFHDLQQDQARRDVKDLYFAFVYKFNRPPRHIDEFGVLSEQYPKGYQAIKDGEWIVLWGTNGSSQNNAGAQNCVVAFHRKFRQGRGWVLTASGETSVESRDGITLCE